MAAKDHLNKELFHGTNDKYGVLRPGDMVVPRSVLQKGTKEKPGTLWHDVETHAFATTNYDDAKEYARNQRTSNDSYNIAVYEVHPAEDMIEDDFHGEEWDRQSYASPTGFRVKRKVWPTE